MLKQTIRFKDFNGKEQERDLYFNLAEFELVDMQASSPDGIQADMERALQEKDMRKLLDFVKMLVHAGYGERDADGIHFHKTKEITQGFINSAMYSPLLLSLFQDEGARLQTFITGLMPADLVQRAIAQSQGGGTQPVPQDFLKKASAEPDSPYTEAPVIGYQPFQAPVTPSAPPVTTQDAGVQPSPADAAPIQPTTPTERAFIVKESNIDEDEAARQREAASRAEFEAWKQAQEPQQ